MSTEAPLDHWLTLAAEALDVPGALDKHLLLDLAREVAHGVARPAAPLTTYLLGLAVGAGADPTVAAATLSRLVADFPEPA